MSFASTSNRSSRMLLSVAFAAVLSLSAGCRAVSVRTRCSVGLVPDATPERLGGPYCVVDDTFPSTWKADGMKARFTERDHDEFHEFCHARYPELFVRGRGSVPILVKRTAAPSHFTRYHNLKLFLWGLTATAVNVFPYHLEMDESVSVRTSEKDESRAEAFKTEISVFQHGFLTYPLRFLLWPERDGWKDEKEYPWDEQAPLNHIRPERQAAIADALVRALEKMTPGEREALAGNQEAWARYYARHPFTYGELADNGSRVVRRTEVEGRRKQFKRGRLPRVTAFKVDDGRMTGSLEADLSGCNPSVSQDWLIAVKLPELMRTSPARKWNSFRIDGESVSPEGRYKLRFTIVD